MTDLRALTIRQPWASLVAVGAKSIETRGFATSYRGPLLIHAGKARPSDLSWERVGEWSLHVEGDEGPEIRRLGAVSDGALLPDRFARGLAHPMPLGAVVASCQLVDCARIVGPFGEGREDERVLAFADGRREPVPDSERPFGDYRIAARYAWLLGDVKPTTDRCPRCWGAGVREVWQSSDRPAVATCETCNGFGNVVPVPMRGRQGLWIPKPEDWSAAS